jgi:hypothetical protein
MRRESNLIAAESIAGGIRTKVDRFGGAFV